MASDRFLDEVFDVDASAAPPGAAVLVEEWLEGLQRGPAARDEAAVRWAEAARPLAAHALRFALTYRAALGVWPAAAEHAEYRASLGSAAPAAFDARRFVAFLQQRRRIHITVAALPNLDAYDAALRDDRAILRDEVVRKVERRRGALGGRGLREACGRPGGGAAPPDAARNPCTGHDLDACDAGALRLHAAACRRDALAFCFGRDYLFMGCAMRATLVVVVWSDSLALAELEVALDAVARASGGDPPFLCTVGAPGPGAAAALARFDAVYHHRLELEDDVDAAWGAVPKLFRRTLVAAAPDAPAAVVAALGASSPCRAAGGSLWWGSRPPSDDLYVEVSDQPARCGADGPLFAPRVSEDVGFLRDGAAARSVVEHAWAGILRHSGCGATGATGATGARPGALQHAQYLLRRAALDRRWSSYRAAPPADAAAGVLLVENRCDVGAALAALVALCNVGPGWGLQVLCAPAARGFFEAAFASLGPGVVLTLTDRLPSECFNIECYNAFMKRADTWDAVAFERVLTVQNDGTLVRPGVEAHPAFAAAYAGAPWLHHPYLDAATGGTLVGNGGFSSRSRAACRRAVAGAPTAMLYPMCPIMSQAEDVFFAQHCQPRCAFSDALTFSMEQVPCPGALGYHRFWDYHAPDFAASVFRTLDAELLALLAART